MSMLPVIVADSDWYQRARFRLYLDDCGFATAEITDGALLTQLLRQHPHPLIVVSAVDLPVTQEQTFLATICADPNLARRHGILLIGEQISLATMPNVVALAPTVDRATFTHAVSQIALRLSMTPRMRLPTSPGKQEDAVWCSPNGGSPTRLLPQ